MSHTFFYRLLAAGGSDKLNSSPSEHCGRNRSERYRPEPPVHWAYYNHTKHRPLAIRVDSTPP